MARIRIMPDGWNIPAPLMAKSIYSIEYNEQYQITAGGGDSFVADHADVENYDDARNAAAAIEDYFRNHGGTAEQTEVKGLELD